MKYANFIETIRKRAVKTAGEDGKVFINKVVKNNGKEMDGLVILENGYSIAPTIYLNDYYENYRCGADIDDIMNEILTIYYRNRDAVCFNTEMFNDFESVKGSIVYKLINFEKNKELLREVPHKRFLDLAVVCYCIVKRLNNYIATTMIKNDFLDKWGVSSDVLFDMAKKNTPELLSARISPITGFLNEISGNDIYEVPDKDDVSMFVMTNETHVNGAACMLYTDVIDRLSKDLDKDLYILPSSVHELIIVPFDDNISGSDLAMIVKDINEKGVAAEEVLSDNVYEFRRSDKKIHL